jgi:hypothetical protein
MTTPEEDMVGRCFDMSEAVNKWRAAMLKNAPK